VWHIYFLLLLIQHVVKAEAAEGLRLNFIQKYIKKFTTGIKKQNSPGFLQRYSTNKDTQMSVTCA
jgi:hypothetical protein